MDFPRDLANTNGAMVAPTKEISNKDSGVDMVYGVQGTGNLIKITKVTIQWTKSQDMEFTNGRMGGFTKAILKTTIEMVLDNFMTESNVFIGAFGLMASKFSQNNLDQVRHLGQLRAYKSVGRLLPKVIKGNITIQMT